MRGKWFEVNSLNPSATTTPYLFSLFNKFWHSQKQTTLYLSIFKRVNSKLKERPNENSFMQIDPLG
jgi:hypothetical protein